MKINPLDVKLRPVNQDDWNFILEIRNQEEVRNACYDTSIIDSSTPDKKAAPRILLVGPQAKVNTG